MNKDVKKVLVLLPVVGQPRFSKRIDMMQEHGHTARVAAFERNLHKKGRAPNCEIVYLGKIEHQQYLKRLPKFIAALSKLRPLLKECDVVYAMGADLLILSMLAGIGLSFGKILETGDLREIQTRKSIVGGFFRKLDSFLCKRLDFLVITAPSFLNIYYRQWVGAKTPALLFENKVESAEAEAIKKALALAAPATAKAGTHIGYFGLLQSRWSWRVLKLLAKQHPHTHHVLMAGFLRHLDDVVEVADATDNISYFGEYKSPGDLSTLYGGIDLSWGCFSPIDPDDWKLRWARSNRFYEACAYETPLLSREGSDEALEVEKYNIGLVIDDKDEQAAVDKIAAITAEQIAQWKTNMQNLPRSVYAYTDESVKLSNALIESARK